MTPTPRLQALRRGWVRLDNASNIFLAARSEADTKVFRMSAELDADIAPAVLQEALEQTYEQYPLFHAVLRQGVFWYYLQRSDLRPVAEPEEGPSVQHLYHRDRHELLFRVLYRGRRISLELFHALTDGTGALWFFQDLLTAYVDLRHADEFAAPLHGPRQIKQELEEDALRAWRRAASRPSVVAQDTTGALDAPEPEQPTSPRIARRDVLSLTGRRTPDNRTRVVEVVLPAGEVLRLARAEGVSLTIYLLAVFFEAIKDTRMTPGKPRTLNCSVPINLRQFFPTRSGRNFFATTMLRHTYDADGGDTIGDVCRDLDRQFKAVLTTQGLERKLRRLIRFERNPALRLFPRPLKDIVLAIVNRIANQGITVAISNLGRVALHGPADRHVGRMYFHVSAVRPQFCAMSHGDELTVSFTSPFVETDYHAAFVRHFSSRGLNVEINVTRVTAEEIGVHA